MALSLGGAVVCSPVAQAQEAAQTAASIQALNKANVISRKVGTAYYKFSLENRKPEERNRMLELIRQADPVVAASASAPLKQAWASVKTASQADPYLNGDVDQLKLYAMEDAQFLLDGAFQQELTRLRTAARLSASSSREQLVGLVVQMERMAGTYIRNAADPLGGSNYAGRDNTDPALMAREFNLQLAKVRKAYQGQASVSAELDDVFKKWNFISARMIDYNQKTVPYIVSTYSDQITRKLLSLYEAAR